jgi:hypothetical protein
MTSVSVQTNPTTLVAMSQLPELSENRKNAKMCQTSEILPNTAVFLLPTLSSTLQDTSAPTTIITAHSETAVFVQNHPKTEKSPIST